MNDEERRKAIATFRFGLIADFVTGVKYTYGEREKLLEQKMSRSYEIPYSQKTQITRSTLLGWIARYKASGYRIEGLYPKVRSDQGKSRRLNEPFKQALIEVRKEKPSFTVPALIRELKQRKRIPEEESFSLSSVYRFLEKQGLQSVNEEAVDKRHFEAEYPNQIWQSDVMHGPYVWVEGKSKKKSYLVAILDDHSRMILHAEFYLSEGIESLKDCLKKAVQSRGLPQKFYVDNGACFKAIHLEHITASLGIAITHSRPYTPQGRGKIERWFRFVQDDFLPLYQEMGPLNKLNELLENWVGEYNTKRVHGSTGQTPYDRFRKNLECVRYAPADLMNHFRMLEYRTVKKDRTFRLNGDLYEAPVQLIDRRIELKYHPENLEEVEIFFNRLSYGFAVRVNPSVNAKIGRSWNPSSRKKPSEKIKENPLHLLPPEEKSPTGGKLFAHSDSESLLQGLSNTSQEFLP